MPYRRALVTVLLGLAVPCCRGRDVAPAPNGEDSPPPLALPSRAALEPAVRRSPRVGLDGATELAPEETAARAFVVSFRAWVQERPDGGSPRLGYLRAGATVGARGTATPGPGCQQGWLPVAPRGYACLGRDVTLDEAHPTVALLRGTEPVLDRRLPYIYGTVRRPGPVYSRLPSDEELRGAEPDLDARMKAWLEASGEVGASYAQEVWLGTPGTPPDPAAAWREGASDGVPPLLLAGRAPVGFSGKARDDVPLVMGRMKPRVGYSLLRTFLHRGRRYGLTAALEVVPTDRLRPIRGSQHVGFEIGKDVTFPFAIVRREGARFWQAQGGKLVEGPSAPYRSAHQLTGKQRFHDGRLHYETKDGRWLSDRDASRLDPIQRMPKWGKDGERWIDVNLTKQTLMLIDGTREVFATLISSGEAGLEDPAHTTATKRGIFRIHTKHLTATMSSREIGEEFELRDVPYVQYFDKEGYALHGAYWHDRFGTPKSHGCINLAPEDARRVFFFTQPELPAGWHGVILPRTGTVLFVHP